MVVIGHALWQRRFGGDPAVVGRTVLLNTRPYTVVGVAPARFRGAGTGLVFDAWVPMMMQMQFEPGGNRLENRGNRWLDVYARLAPGVSLDEAQAELGVLSHAHRRPRTSARRSDAVWRSTRCGGPRAAAPRFSARSSWCSAASAPWCCCSPAPTSRACCSRAASTGAGRSRSASRSGRDAAT